MKINKASVHIAIYVLAIIFLGFSIFRIFLMPSEKNITSTAPLFTSIINDPEGKPQSLKQFENKIIVLNFWATWCEPCREEMPELSNFYTENSSKNIVVIGIAIDEAKAVKSYLKKTKVMYPILVDEDKGVILSKNLGNNQGILPYTVIINSNGSVQKTIFGRIHKDQLDATLKPLLQPSKSL
ncbi:MAG TPA: redoxin [Methylophilaceae bacterium]|nr:redoxin [Methylophilaceae bacterium]